jgi:hypothetical protein
MPLISRRSSTRGFFLERMKISSLTHSMGPKKMGKPNRQSFLRVLIPGVGFMGQQG